MAAILTLALLSSVGANAELVPNSHRTQIAVEEAVTYFQIHFRIRFTDCQGDERGGFARVRSGIGSTGSTTLLTKRVSIDQNVEMWDFYFRAPRYSNQAGATYQIEAGYLDPTDVNFEVVRMTEAFRVKRNLLVNAEPLPIPKRELVDGKIRPAHTALKSDPVLVPWRLRTFGVILGEDTAKRVN